MGAQTAGCVGRFQSLQRRSLTAYSPGTPLRSEEPLEDADDQQKHKRQHDDANYNQT